MLECVPPKQTEFLAMPKARPREPRIILTDADIRDGVKALRRKCAVMRCVHDAAGDPPLRRRAAGFEGLARIVVGQQLSVASAEAIWGRTALAVQPFEARGLLLVKDRGKLAVLLDRDGARGAGHQSSLPIGVV